MLKFRFLDKLKFLIGCITVFKYTIWTIFFILQGRAIDLAVSKHDIHGLIKTLFLYIQVKLIVMLCDVSIKFLTEYFKNKELQSLWACYFPSKIYRDTCNSQEEIQLLFFDYLPKLYNFQLNKIINYATLGIIGCISFFLFIYTEFYYGIIILLSIFLLNFSSKTLFIKNIDKLQTQINAAKSEIFIWVNHYLKSYREISKNWPMIEKGLWPERIYNDYYVANKLQSILYLYRDIASQLLVEIPFLISTIIVIVCVYYSYIGLTEMFLWIGISQFMINASNSYFENVNLFHQITIFNNLSLAIIEKLSDSPVEGQQENSIGLNEEVDFSLQDGTANIIALKPKIYWIKGANGSGKTTLLNIILKYERKFTMPNNDKLSNFSQMLGAEYLRVIDRDAVIFDCLKDFGEQICGPDYKSIWLKIIEENVTQLLGPKLSKEWFKIFQNLETKYVIRNNNSFSSGERVLVSIMRFFFSWNQKVQLLVIDECNAFLDLEKKKLLNQTIDILSSKIAIYMVSHEGALIEHGQLFHERSLYGLAN